MQWNKEQLGTVISTKKATTSSKISKFSKATKNNSQNWLEVAKLEPQMHAPLLLYHVYHPNQSKWKVTDDLTLYVTRDNLRYWSQNQTSVQSKRMYYVATFMATWKIYLKNKGDVGMEATYHYSSKWGPGNYISKSLRDQVFCCFSLREASNKDSYANSNLKNELRQTCKVQNTDAMMWTP